MDKPVRIKDIAIKAGVSTGTVDRVLHKRGNVKPETAELIKKIAKEMNYQPNLIARALTSKQTHKLAVLLPEGGEVNQFWAKHPEGISKGIENYRAFGLSVEYFYFELYNEKDFTKKAEEVIKTKPDGVIMAPVLQKESECFCSKLDALKIPYLFVDTHIENTHSIYFVGENAYQSGRVAASLVDFGVPKDKDILIVNFLRDMGNSSHIIARNQGFHSYFLDNPKNHSLKISVEIPEADQRSVSKYMDEILTKNPNIGSVLVTSSKTHLVAKYLEKIEEISLIGYDVTDKNLDYLKKGNIQFLIAQRPIEQCEKAVATMFAYLSNRKPEEKLHYQPIDIVNRENVDLYEE